MNCKNKLYDYFELKQEGLGDRFVNEFDEYLELLRSFPEMYTKFDEEVRKHEKVSLFLLFRTFAPKNKCLKEEEMILSIFQLNRL